MNLFWVPCSLVLLAGCGSRTQERKNLSIGDARVHAGMRVSLPARRLGLTWQMFDNAKTFEQRVTSRMAVVEPKCPREFELEEYPGVRVKLMNGRRLTSWIFRTRFPRMLVVKIMPPEMAQDHLEMFVHEYVLLDILQAQEIHNGFTAKFAHVGLQLFHPVGVVCPMIVMEDVGESTLADLPPVSPIAEIAALLLNQLKEVHATGFVHGDVHAGNIVWDGRNFNSFRFIDFGESRPFVDWKTRTHILPIQKRVSPVVNQDLLSRWERLGYPKSRRDDLSRLATALGNYPVVTEFYKYVQSLEFDTVPKYDFWIQKFTKEATSEASV